MMLGKYLKGSKAQMVIGMILKLIEAIFELFVPVIMAEIIDTGIVNADKPFILRKAGLILLLNLSGLIFALIAQYLAAKSAQRFGTTLRSEMFFHINKLSYGEIDVLTTPSLITRMISDINQLQHAVNMTVRLITRAPFLLIGATVMSMIIDIKLSVIFLIAAPLIALVIFLVMRKSVPYYKEVQKKLDKISAITRENLDGVRVIRAFSKQEDEMQRFHNANDDYADTSIRVSKIAALLNPITFLIMNSGIIAILYVGGIRVNIGGITTGKIIALINYMSQILLSLVVVANVIVIFTRAHASNLRIKEVFNTVPSITDKDNQKIDINNESNNNKEDDTVIEFKDVNFSYSNNGEYALKNINFKIKKGETIGIIGGTGSGKSTIISLIPRFYDVTSGNVFVNGKDVRDYSLLDLRKLIGIVQQRAVLFKGTVFENMKLKDVNATKEEIDEALKISQSYDFVMEFPEKYNHMVLAGGKNLSGGQKQRLTIARALVGNPDILILDDSSSALDYTTDLKLRRAIANLTNKKTLILVSQRAATIKNADKIIVVDEGKIIDIGNHKELLSRSGIYSEIFNSQMGGVESL